LSSLPHINQYQDSENGQDIMSPPTSSPSCRRSHSSFHRPFARSSSPNAGSLNTGTRRATGASLPKPKAQVQGQTVPQPHANRNGSKPVQSSPIPPDSTSLTPSPNNHLRPSTSRKPDGTRTPQASKTVCPVLSEEQVNQRSKWAQVGQGVAEGQGQLTDGQFHGEAQGNVCHSGELRRS
jgi:hypothetical protein